MRDLCDTCARWTEDCPWVRDYNAMTQAERKKLEDVLIHKAVRCTDYEEERR